MLRLKLNHVSKRGHRYPVIWINNHISGFIRVVATHPYPNCLTKLPLNVSMIMSWHGNAFRITGPLWGESTVHWWITLTKGQWCVPLVFPSLIVWTSHDDVIKWKHFPRYWPFVRGIHRSPVNTPHKGRWRGVLMFSLICARMNGWVNNAEAGDLRRHRAHYGVIVMGLVTWR